MKSFKFLGLSVVAAMLLVLTSCLNGNNEEQGIAFGVYAYNSTYQPVVHTDTNRDMVFSGLESRMNDKYCIFSYKLNYEMQDQTKPYYQVELTGTYVKVPDGGYARSIFNNDELAKQENEQTFTQIVPAAIVLADRVLFFENTLNNAIEKQTTFYQLYYNLDSVDTSGTEKVYNLYMKATRDKTGESTSLGLEYIAFDIENFWRAASDKEGKNDFKINFKYVKSINKETNAIEWGQISQPILFYNLNKENSTEN